MSRSVLSSVNAITFRRLSPAFSLFFLLLEHTRQPPAPLIHLSKIHSATFIKFRLIKVDGGGYLRYLGSRSQIKLVDPSSLSFERSSRARESPTVKVHRRRERRLQKLDACFASFSAARANEQPTRSRCIYFSPRMPGTRARTVHTVSFLWNPSSSGANGHTDLGCIMHPADKHLGSASDIHFTAVVLWKKKQKKKDFYARQLTGNWEDQRHSFKLYRTVT